MPHNTGRERRGARTEAAAVVARAVRIVARAVLERQARLVVFAAPPWRAHAPARAVEGFDDRDAVVIVVVAFGLGCSAFVRVAVAKLILVARPVAQVAAALAVHPEAAHLLLVAVLADVDVAGRADGICIAHWQTALLCGCACGLWSHDERLRGQGVVAGRRWEAQRGARTRSGACVAALYAAARDAPDPVAPARLDGPRRARDGPSGAAAAGECRGKRAERERCQEGRNEATRVQHCGVHDVSTCMFGGGFTASDESCGAPRRGSTRRSTAHRYTRETCAVCAAATAGRLVFGMQMRCGGRLSEWSQLQAFSGFERAPDMLNPCAQCTVRKQAAQRAGHADGTGYAQGASNR